MRTNLSHLLVMILWFTLGCGKKPETNVEPSIGSSNPLSESEDARKFFRETQGLQIQCLEQDCPEGIFFVTARRYTTGENYSCSGLLVATNKLVVPSACLPTRLLKNGKNCESSVLARDYRSGDVYSCDQVLDVNVLKDSEKFPETWKNDFVVLQFKSLPTATNFLIPNREGLLQKKQYALWSYRTDLSTGRVLLQDNYCFIEQENYVQPLGKKPYSPSLSLVACANDSTLNNQDLGGVLFKEVSFGNYKALGMANALFSDFGSNLNLEEGFRGAGLIQNFACFEYLLKSRGRRAPRSCQQELRYDLVRDGRYSLLKLNRSSDEFLQFFKEVEDELIKGDEFLRWEVTYESTSSEVIFIPVVSCFHNMSSWIGRFRESGVFGRRIKKEHIYSLEWKNWVLTPTLTLEGRIEHEFEGKEPTGLRKYELTFSPRDLYKDRESLVHGMPSGVLNLRVCR